MSPARPIALVIPALACALALAACGGGSDGTTTGVATAPSTTGQSAAAAPGAASHAEDDPASDGGLNAVFDLCGVADLNERASRLFPAHKVRCYPAPGRDEPSAQLSGATWVWGKVNRNLGTTESGELINATVKAVEPAVGTATPTDEPHLESACPPPSEDLRCHESHRTISGNDCLTRQASVPGDAKSTIYQLDCYLGRTTDSGLDVSLYTEATGPLDPDEVEDFAVAVIRAAQDD